MKRSDALKQKRAAVITKWDALVRLAETENRELSTEENDTITGYRTEAEGLDGQIDNAESLEQRAIASAATGASVVDGEQREQRSVERRFDVKRMMGFVVDRAKADGAEAEINEIAIAELRNSGVQNVNTKGFNVPSSMAFRGAKSVSRADAQTVGEDAGAFGGTLVKEDAGVVLPNFVDRLTIEDLGISPKYDLVGDYPLHSIADFAFENVGETEGLTPQKTGMAKRVLKPKRTGMMAYISNQLLAQSSINVMGVLQSRITEALNRRLFQDMINGDGTAPNCLGILNDALAFDFAGAAGALSLAKILELEGEIDEENATENGRRFLLHTKLASIAKGIPLDAGSGLFLMDKDNSLYGMPATKTTLVPTLNGGAEYPLIYGDWPSIEAGFWGGLNIKADDTTRADSNEVRLIINVHRDIMASNPKAFAANKKITIA